MRGATFALVSTTWRRSSRSRLGAASRLGRDDALVFAAVLLARPETGRGDGRGCAPFRNCEKTCMSRATEESGAETSARNTPETTS